MANELHKNSLDKVFPITPISIMRNDCHAYFVNSSVLSLLEHVNNFKKNY